MKRFFALCLIILLLAGCTSSPAPSGPSASLEDASPAPTPSPAPITTPSPSPAEPSEAPPPENSPDEPPEVISFQFTEGNFPRIDGSTATIPLGQMLYAALLGKPMEEAAEAVSFTGTAGAWSSLQYQNADLLVVYEAAEDTARMLDGLRELEFAPIGRDALIFLVNAQNSTDDLTAEQLQGIYTGEITNWQEVGGGDTPIAAYQRNPASGSQAMMEKLVMAGLNMAPAPSTMMIAEMGGLVDAVASYENGGGSIGYNVYYYVSQMKNDPNVKLLSVNGVGPDNGSIQSGAYPFVNDFYAAIRKNEPAGSPARILYDWLRSADGQALIEAAGYVPAG